MLVTLRVGLGVLGPSSPSFGLTSGAHLGSSAGRHSTEWYKPFTATSHSRSMAEVLSLL